MFKIFIDCLIKIKLLQILRVRSERVVYVCCNNVDVWILPTSVVHHETDYTYQDIYYFHKNPPDTIRW